MATGWVSIHRELTEHWLWEEKPFSYGHAWVDLLIMANHKDSKVPLGNEVIFIERGSFITSELKLMERWGWSKSKVRRFLELLQKDEMILKKTDKKKTTLTLCNYSDYQDLKTDKRPIKDRLQTDSRPIKDTNNNDNNDNNANKGTKKMGDVIAEYTEDEILRAVLKEFASYRAKGKSAFTPHAMKLITINLDKLAKTPSEKVDILNQSMVRGWTGVFAIKQDYQKEPYKKETNVDRARKILFGEDEPHEPDRNEEIIILDDNDLA